MGKINMSAWMDELEGFKENTHKFYTGEMAKNDYKGYSGRYGSYAQRGGQASMLRLRMTAGRVTKDKLKYVADMIREYDVKMLHFTTCEAIQVHNLPETVVCEMMVKAMQAGIITMGGGGDFPRNVMCSPLTGVEAGEYFDVMPYALAAGQHLLGYIDEKKMPRKLKVCFSNSPANVPHATYRDLGFVATPEGKFDVYSAGGLGNNPKFGVKVAEGIEPDQILYYIHAMWLTFITYGNYENRGKARTRYMQDAVGGPEAYKAAYLEKLEEARKLDLPLVLDYEPAAKAGDGTTAEGKRVIPQKQDGLYTVVWHPIGGQPAPASICALSDAIADMEGVEMRLSADETAYIINLTGAEAEKVIAATPDSAQSVFETSVSCIGASICQVGLRDSQELLHNCVEAVRAADLPDGALPQIHISGCPSSCGTHQTGSIGFRGHSKRVDGAMQAAFMLFVNGCDRQGQEAFGSELGAILADQIPAFLVKLGQTVAASGMAYPEWIKANPDGVAEVAKEFI